MTPTALYLLLPATTTMAGHTMHDILRMTKIAEAHHHLEDTHHRMVIGRSDEVLLVCSAANFVFQKTDPGRLHVECHPEPKVTTTLESRVYDEIETILATTEMTRAEDLRLRVLERPKAIEIETVKVTNRQATTVEAEAEVLGEIDHLTLVVHRVVK
ncbi:hypothetical protein MMC18_009141 [Xylographa bjoerkii]|nr:hypothetical protein [Xylographa bjoerkii]